MEQFGRLEQIPKPKLGDIKFIQQWLKGDTAQKRKPFLARDPEDVWTKAVSGVCEPADPEDFYSFAEHDSLTYVLISIYAWITGIFSCVLACVFPRKTNPDKFHHVDSTLSGGLGKTIMTAIASLMPVIPIVAFYFVEKLIIRIGMIVAFTAAFAVILVVVLEMKPDKALAISTA